VIHSFLFFTWSFELVSYSSYSSSSSSLVFWPSVFILIHLLVPAKINTVEVHIKNITIHWNIWVASHCIHHFSRKPFLVHGSSTILPSYVFIHILFTPPASSLVIILGFFSLTHNHTLNATASNYQGIEELLTGSCP